MCELLGMSSRYPAALTFSLEEFARHGGSAKPHKDGWGIASYEDGDARVLRDVSAASTNPFVQFLQAHPISSTIVVSHIRKATLGTVALRNTQPFARELGGRMHVFAHNGHLPTVREAERFRLARHRPIGETDSEHAFCCLLARLEPAWLGHVKPPIARRLDIVADFAREMAQLGPANFLYADGELLIAHGNRRTHEDGAIHPPGLHVLTRECHDADATLATEGLKLSAKSPRQKIVLFASVPLSAEPWRALGEGEVIACLDGELWNGDTHAA